MRPEVKIYLRRLVSNLFSGDYLSNQRAARGPEPMVLREFRPGDDTKAIDLKVSAKKGKLFVRLKRAERAGRLIFLIDRSKSGEFGTCEAKLELQALLVDVLAYAGAHEGCQTAFISFTDQLESIYWPPQFGIEKACEKAKEIFTRIPKGTLTDLNVGLRFLTFNPVSCSLVFLVSDFLSPLNYTKALSIVALKHDLVPLIIKDRMEEELPKLRGFVSLEDIETGQDKYLNLRKESPKGDQYLGLFRKLNLDWLECYTQETSEELEHKLREFFEARRRRRKRWV